jgi:pSer/pThr/pTyr-binding forkhead associated (FHA) protein
MTVTLTTSEGTEHPLEDSLTVGRSEDCDITLPSSKVSRQHARFQHSDGGVTVEDLGSSNGTRLNGRAIAGVQALMDGDQVVIDRFTLTLKIVDPGAETEATVLAAPPEDEATVVAPPPTGDAASGAEAAAPDVVEQNRQLPGSWVDSGTGESTQFLSPEARSSEPSEAVDTQRHSSLGHFVVIAGDGRATDVFELETGGGEEDTWELGREDSCDICLTDPTVSARHAQVVHRGGRWRMVNLVSSNGILVNGEKRLSVYLDSGDRIQLGGVCLVFHAPEGGSANAPAMGSPGTRADSTPAAKNRTPLFVGLAVLLTAVAAALYFYVR